MKAQATSWGYLAGWRLIRLLPEPVAKRIFRAAADRAFRRDGKAVRRLASNLRRVMGPETTEAELAAATKAGMRSYARYWLEAFRLPTWRPTDINRRFRISNREVLEEAVAQGAGAVVALPHCANWDHAGAWAVTNGWRLTSVAERLKPASLYDRFVEYRESIGMDILPLTGGPPVLPILERRLAAGHIVALLADRDLSRTGVEVKFFGGRTRMPPGPARLAITTGAPLLTVSLWYDDAATVAQITRIPVQPTDSVAEVTQRIADAMAEGIAAHPTDWHMLQRLWLDDPEPRPNDAATRQTSTGPDASPGAPLVEDA